MTRKITFALALALLGAPGIAFGYLNPEDVLLNRDLYLPPTSREAQDRTTLQTSEAAARREREQERAFSLQRPEPEVVVEQSQDERLFGSAPEAPSGAVYVYPVPVQGSAGFSQQLFGSAPTQGLTDAANLELLRTMRLLSRVNQNQAIASLQPQEVLHSGAPDLTPTGAGSVMAATVMLGSVGYTLFRTKKMGRVIVE